MPLNFRYFSNIHCCDYASSRVTHLLRYSSICCIYIAVSLSLSTVLRDLDFWCRFQNIVQNQASNYTAAASDSVNVSGAEQLAPTSVVLDAVQNESQSRFHESVGDQVSGHTETIESNMPTVNSQEQNLQEGPSEDISRDWQESRELRVIERQNSVAEEPDGSWQNESQNQVQIDEVQNRDDRLQEHGRWNDASPQVSVDNWHEQHGNVSRMQRTSIRRINGFQPPDDDSVYSMELRELLSRLDVCAFFISEVSQTVGQF